ncbi:MAG: hypothetical protein R3F30_03345 [Planctomycetota bacterium]
MTARAATLAAATGVGLCLLLGLWAWPVGLRADDWLLRPLLTSPDDPAALSWRLVAEDWVTPWLASETWPYYRPLSTLSYGAWIGLVGLGTDAMFLLGPLLWAAATLLFALVTRRLVRRPAALVAGTVFFAVHPVAVEPAQWFSASPEVLQLCLGLGSVLAWIRHRDTASRASAVTAALLLLLAVLCRESGALTVVATVLLGAVGVGWRPPPRGAPPARWLACLWPLVVPLALYGLLRLQALGPARTFLAGPGGGDALAGLATLPERLTLLLSPALALGGGPALAAALAAVLALTAVLVARAPRRLAAVLALLLVVQLLPGIAHPVGLDFGGSRVLIWAVAGASWLWAAGLDAGLAARAPWAAAVVLGLVVSLGGSVLALADRVSATHEALAISRRVGAEADRRLADVAAPVAVVALPEA